MDFEHSDERKMLADTLDRWVLQDYPLAARLTAGASELGYARDKWASLAELGVIGALFAEEDGGFGGHGFDLSVVFQSLGRGLVVEPLLQSGVLGGGAVALGGGQAELIEALISGEKQTALAHFEASDGGEIDAIEAVAEKTRDGWRLRGQKAVVRSAASADFLVVSAKSAAGVSLFMVPSDNGGLSLQTYQTIDGGSASEVLLDAVDLPTDALIGTEGQGAEILTEVLGRGVLCLCAEALGLMEVIRDITVEFLQTRKQFGLPIGKFQALQHRMAEMLLEIEQVKSAVINAADVVDTPGRPRERALSAAKYTVGRVGKLVAEEAIQMHGGMGMTWEYPLGHFAKRLVMIDHELGDEDHHLTRFIALGRADGRADG
ncbi:MAG: pimeloyl-CoA dehydrogenase small subunit [Alphaproteobacteria bacterium]|nr:pimeloyl-CoA dehydrogenase small subunit [Alphaproteobacteria bacterium]